ncbi:uncharacterized protein LOC127009186 [Eriocheir sinensis]|uniref:uncharacterized protein LOC127009186 n=1 Tax=Eriocheir sinensis TaxID=95602 RepID=UPI0021C5845B|nr:uncharacterized protein LOC127009186 [Eriocheir sinensis]
MNWTLLSLVCGLVGALAIEEKADVEREILHKERFIAKITTSTRLALTTTTTTVPFTCASLSTRVCRRRRKRSATEDLGGEIKNEGVELFSGHLEDPEVEYERRSGRISFTLGTVTTTTFTITSTSINSATTFSISYFCSAPNAVYPPGC